MNNITLIGMPGVGKSTIGVVLAKVLGYQFLDSDLLIQKQEHRRLWQIIEEEGYEGFQNVENRVNASIEAENTVIATGGSVVYCEEAMKHLKSVGTVVYLKLSLNSLAKRLGNLKGRGVLLREGQTLESLYEEGRSCARSGGERSGSKSGASFGNTKRESKVTIVQAGEQKCTEEIFIYK